MLFSHCYSHISFIAAISYHTYRIPALLVTQAGTVLAICEGRRNNRSDHGDVDLMVNGLVGAPGMEPTVNAIKSGVNVALSNKESLE